MTGAASAAVVALLLLWLALWTVIARDAFLAVAGFVVYGLLLSLVWVRLSGIDVALTEAAIGGGLTGALLIGAVGRLRGTEAAAWSERSGAATRAVAVLLSVGVSSGAGAVRAGAARARADAGAAGAARTCRPPAWATRSPACCWPSARWTRCSRRSCW